MSEAVLRQWRSADGADAPWFVVFDTTISEEVTLESKCTEDPVAGGSPINDHMYDLPAKLTLSCVVSDSPPGATYEALGWRSLDQALADGVSAVDPLTGVALDYKKPRSVVALERLETLRKAHEPFCLKTGLKLFQNVVCLKVHYTTDLKSGNVLAFTAEIQEVRIVNTQTVLYPATKVPKKASRPTDNGKVYAPPVTGLGPLPPEKRKSLLKAMVASGNYDAAALDPNLVANRQGPLVQGAD